jgi:hypothetical protein
MKGKVWRDIPRMRDTADFEISQKGFQRYPTAQKCLLIGNTQRMSTGKIRSDFH